MKRNNTKRYNISEELYKVLNKSKIEGFQEGRKQTLEEVEKMIDERIEYYNYVIDNRITTGEKKLIKEQLKELQSKIKSLGEGK